MIDKNLINYISQNINGGFNIQSIQNTLIKRGYPTRNVYDTINYVTGTNPNTPQKSQSQKSGKKIWLFIGIPIGILIVGLLIFLFMGSSKTISENEFSQGINFELKENKEVKFILDEEEHTIKINSVSGDTVNLIIQSNPLQIDIKIGEEKKFDLDDDGFYDLKIKLKDIKQGIPELYIKKIHERICTENWNCEDWSSCSEQESQTRTCTDLNSCGTIKEKPTSTQSCTYVENCVEDWDCENWSSCVNESQVRVCTDLNSCGTIENKSNEQQECENVDECLIDEDCNDGDFSTKEVCSGTPKKCSHSTMTECITGDNYCPTNCDYSTDEDCELTDSIKIECGENIWCYHDKVVETNDYTLCFNINNYWNDEDQGVVGSCIESIARNLDDCSLCEYIVKQDIHNSCVRDFC